MPAVLDALEVVDYTEHDRDAEQPRVRPARAGFWHTLVQYMRRHRVHRVRRTMSSREVSVYTFETPAELLARQSPALYLQAFAGA